MPLPYPLTFYGSKVFRFPPLSSDFRNRLLASPAPFTLLSQTSPKVRKDSFLQKRKYTDEIFHFRKRPIHPGTGKQKITLTERKISQRRNSITQRRHFINQRRKSFRQLRKDYFTTNCLHDKTGFLYSILRIQSKNIISYCLPSPILRRIFLTNLFNIQNGISHSRTSASSASSEAPMHQNKKDPEQKMSGVFYQVFTDLQFKLLQQLLRKEFLQKLPCEV